MTVLGGCNGAMEDVGEGYCPNHKELDRTASASECMAAAQADADCIAGGAISWGKGQRTTRCLCDRERDCDLSETGLGEDGYDRFVEVGESSITCSHLTLTSHC